MFFGGENGPLRCVGAAIHLVNHGDLTAQYLLIIDALNFCFWPQDGLEYEHLATGVKVSSAISDCPDSRLFHVTAIFKSFGKLILM